MGSTMDNKQDHELLFIAARRLVELGDDPGIFMTCEGGGGTKPFVRLGCQNLRHAQEVKQAIIAIVAAARNLRTEETIPEVEEVRLAFAETVRRFMTYEMCD